MLIRNSRYDEIMAELEGQVARLRPDLVRPLSDVEQAAIESALILCGGDRGMAAKRLGVSRAAIYRYVRKYREQDVG